MGTRAVQDMAPGIQVARVMMAGVIEIQVRGIESSTGAAPAARDTVARLMEIETTPTRPPAAKDMVTMIQGRQKRTGLDCVTGVGKEDITPVSVRRLYPPAATETPAGEVTTGETTAHRREEMDMGTPRTGTIGVTPKTGEDEEVVTKAETPGEIRADGNHHRNPRRRKRILPNPL